MSGRRPRVRSRSRSPDRTHHQRNPRDKDRYTDKDRVRHRREREHRRSRSKSPRRHASHSREVYGVNSRESDRTRHSGNHRRSRSRSPHKERLKLDKDKHVNTESDIHEPEQPVDEESLQMKQIMGFYQFDSTKGKRVHGNNNASACKISQPKHYRQYMNRRGGFNRPLDPIH